jgi:CheY-like chemotaxis protein
MSSGATCYIREHFVLTIRQPTGASGGIEWARNDMGSSDSAGDSTSAPHSTPAGHDDGRWRLLIAELGAEIAHPLTAALERIHALTSSGRIDRAALRALRDEVATARQVGMTAQLLARFANRQLQQSRERVALADSLQSVLTHRKRETETRGIALQPTLTPAEVIVDASLAFSLLNTLLDWALVHARSRIDFILDMHGSKSRVALICRFELPPAAGSGVGPAEPHPLDSLTWRLLEQTAAAMNLDLSRVQVDQAVAVHLEFALATQSDLDGRPLVDLDEGFDSTINSKPLAGSHVLVVASRREVRTRVRDAIRNMGLLVDLVGSIEEAVDFCRDGLPHALIIEGILHGERCDRLCSEIRAEVPGFPFIDIVEQGAEFSVSDADRNPRAWVGQDAIESGLPPVLTFELSRTL